MGHSDAMKRAGRIMSTNRYLEGNYGPVREELTVADLPVTGTIPDHLDGRYLRNGPNPVVDADPADRVRWLEAMLAAATGAASAGSA